MKRLLLTFAAIVLASSAIPRAQAVDVSFDFFYNNVSGGTWIEVADYGYCWQPDIAVRSPSWRPYTDGYWVYSDVGWTWVSYEDFGWATYHYGRWVRLSNRGWVWVVGRDSDLEWGPSWVSWRTGGDYVGWAPLPPRRRGGLAFLRGSAITGRVDIEFDIGPSYYNFVDVRYIGEPVLRERIYAPTQNITYIQQTVNVTNITYQNNVVYNNGPDYNTIVARSSRPVPRLTLERQANVDPAAAAKSGGLMKVEGQKLVVAAPQEVKPGAKAAPPVVKEKIAKAEVDDGWTGADPKAKEELQKKIETEDPKKIPAATGAASPAATGAAAAGATASPAATVAAGATASPVVTGSPATTPVDKGKGKSDEKGKPGATVAPAATASPATTPELGKPGKGKRGDVEPTSSPSSLATAAPAFSPATGKEKGKPDRGDSAATPSQLGGAPTEAPQGKEKGKGQLERSPLGAKPGQPADSSTEKPKEKGKAKQFEPSTTPLPSGDSGESPRGGKKSQSLDQTGGPPVGGGQPSDGGQAGKRKGPAASSEPPSAPAGGGPTGAGAGPSGGGKAKPADEGGKQKGKKGDEAAPSPTP